MKKEKNINTYEIIYLIVDEDRYKKVRYKGRTLQEAINKIRKYGKYTGNIRIYQCKRVT